MNKLTITLFAPTLLIATRLSAQIPDNIDPGNPRGEDGTTYFWEQPQLYVPAIIAIVIVMVILWYGRKRRK